MMEKGYKETYINTILKALKAFHVYLFSESYIKVNTTLDLKLLKEPSTVIETFDDSEVRLLLSYYKIKLSRFLEFTEMNVKNKFEDLENDDVVNEISELPCLFLNEIGRGEVGYLGKIFNVKIRSKYIGFSFEKIQEIPIETVKSIGFELDIDVERRGITELHHTHWAIKKVNLLEELEELYDSEENMILSLDKPKVFVSYSWESDETREVVKRLVGKLESDGIDVIYDKKRLRLGQDMNYFMESLSTDKSIKKVLVICDKSYKMKANSRKGGVGTESEIIIDEVYGKPLQNKIIPVFVEKNDKNEPYLPRFLKSRFGIDLSYGLDGKKYNELKEDIFSH